MAKIKELNTEAWEAWVAGKPPGIQELCRRLPPDRLYQLQPDGHRVFLVSYEEDGTVTVAVSGQFNAVVFERNVFGVKPDDLLECDLPDPGESLGALLP